MAQDPARHRSTPRDPLIRRLTEASTAAELRSFLDGLEIRAVVDDLIPKLAAETQNALEGKSTATRGDPALARSKIQFAATLYLGRRISFVEYIFTVAHAVDSVHQASRNTEELEELSAALESEERAHGRADGKHLPIDESSEEYRRLNKLWEQASARQRQEAFDELEGREAAALLKSDPEEFDRLRERGRRALFQREDLISALTDTIIRYEHEASAAAAAGAFTAAVTIIGGALEGMLLLKCLQSPRKVSRVIAGWPGKERPKPQDRPEKWPLDHLIKVCHAAGWLSEINTSSLTIKPEGLAHWLRNARNYIHPGKTTKVRPWVAVERREYEDARHFYNALYVRLFRGSLLRRVAEIERISTLGRPPEAN